MAQVLVNETSLTAIADAIREKNGSADTYKPGEMAAAIGAISTGGGDIPEEAFTVTGNCSYRFANGGWDWFVNLYGNRITTTDITLSSNMFWMAKTIEEIPFDINIKNTNKNFSNLFKDCNALKALPRIVSSSAISIPTNKYSFIDVGGIWEGCYNIREIPEDYFSFLPDGYWEAKKSYGVDGKGSFCYGLRSLREVPWSLLPPFFNDGTSASYSMYRQMFYYCYALNEVVDLPVETATYTSNIFTNTFHSCARLKNITFATNEDGSAKTANWKGQTIDLTTFVGYSSSSAAILGYNSGITADKEVTDDETYQALLEDSDWFTADVAYSRYNRDSALATINSLPDTSAYLAANGGTNTIKFKGAAGELTDGCAIETLTEEEIAVATAKGWTVTFA